LASQKPGILRVGRSTFKKFASQKREFENFFSYHQTGPLEFLESRIGAVPFKNLELSDLSMSIDSLFEWRSEGNFLSGRDIFEQLSVQRVWEWVVSIQKVTRWYAGHGARWIQTEWFVQRSSSPLFQLTITFKKFPHGTWTNDSVTSCLQLK
jgi:hypothetical protein